MTHSSNWYDLFSRGARDWLRHNDKIRAAVRGQLPELISAPDLITGSQQRTVQVPVRLLEHAHFQLATPRKSSGAGQGAGKPGDVLLPAPMPGQPGQGGNEEGAISLLLEFSIDDILDWIWEEFHLPELKPTENNLLDQTTLVREGWDKRGAAARLDRRRTIKQALKRRAIQPDPPAFTNEDLRFRQVRIRHHPSSSAVVFFVMDVSASMEELQRRLAKTFFFFALQGIRRKYKQVATRFIAHTGRAWEFTEADFFEVSGSGGTVASSAFRLALSLIEQDYNGAQYNRYLFYTSDGENFAEDRSSASQALGRLARELNYMAYAETQPGSPLAMDTEMRRLFIELERQQLAVAHSLLTCGDDVWTAIRKFFTHQSMAEHNA